MNIPYDNDTPGSITPLPGMTVWFGTTPNSYDIGVVRLRSWNGSNAINVAENDDTTPYVSNNNYISIRTEFRLWPRYPRILIQGTRAIVLEDYDLSFVDQTLHWPPVAVAGPPAVVEFNGSTMTARFVGDRSFALADGATITGYLWTAPGSVEGTSTSQGTQASPVTFTWTSAGQKLVYLRVTDSNGKQRTNYTWAFGVDPNNPEGVAYIDFDAYNDSFDFEQGGGACSFTVHGGATIADFPNEALVVMASRPTTPGQTTPTGYWPNRDNVHFVGYVLGDTVRQNPTDGDVTFQAATVDALMKNLTMFPVSLTYDNTPQTWTQAANLTPDRAASFLWHFHSTLSLMAPLVPSNYSGLIYRQDFGPGDLYSQLDSELLQTMWGKVVVNHQGVVHHLIDYNLMNNSERSGVTVRKTLHKGVWVNDFNIEERHAYSNPVNVVKASGIIYNGGPIDDVCPSFSEAPGNAPKVYGKEMDYDRLILTSQSDLNIRTGRALAKHTARYSAFSTEFINDGSFTIAPQELFPSNIEGGDNNRGLALTTRLIPRNISRAFDFSAGAISYDVGFEPETDGPPGVTVDLPCNPPEQKWPDLPVEAIIQEEPPPAGDSNFGEIWNNEAGGTDGLTVFGTIGSIDLASNYTYEAVQIREVANCGLTTSKALIVFKQTASGDTYARILNIDSSQDVDSAGSSTLITATIRINHSVIALSSTSALLVYDDGADVYGVVMTVSGDVITVGTEYTIGTVPSGVEVSQVARLSATKAIVTFPQGSSAPVQAAILDISGTVITANAQNDATTGNGGNLADVVGVDSSTAIILYRKSSDVTARAALLTSITTGFTITDDIEISVDGPNQATWSPKWFVIVDTNKALGVWTYDTGATFNIVGAIIETDGSTLTAGSVETIATSGGVLWRRTPSVARLSSELAIVSYFNQYGGGAGQIKGSMKTVAISGDTLTANADEVDFSAQIDTTQLNHFHCICAMESPA